MNFAKKNHLKVTGKSAKAQVAKFEQQSVTLNEKDPKDESHLIRKAGKETKSWQRPTGGSLSQKRMNQRTFEMLQRKAQEQDRATGDDKNSNFLLNKLKLENLDSVTKSRAPPIVSGTIYGATALTMFSSSVFLISAGYFTPAHTNAFSVFVGTASQLVVMIGCGGLTGLRYANFSVLPSVAKQMELRTDGSQTTLLNSMMTSFLPCACLFTSLTMLDQMILWSPAPAVLGMGILGTSVYYHAKRLEVPLWYSRQNFRFLVLAIFSYLLMGYLVLKRNVAMQQHDKLFHQIQLQLDTDKSNSKVGQAEQSKKLEQQRAELQKLKDPFI